MSSTATYADRPWLANYPAEVPKAIDVAGLKTVTALLQDSIASHAGSEAFESFGKTMTYAEVGSAARAFAGALHAAGFGKGDRVALMMPNVLAYPVALFGTLFAGCTVVNVNPLYTPRELIHQLNDSGAKGLVVLENFAHVAAEALPKTQVKTVVVTTTGDLMGLKGLIVNLVSRHVKKLVPAWSIPGAMSLKAFLASGAGGPKPVSVTLDDVAFLQYTGGTTGVSKGAALTHRNVSANLAQVRAMLHEVTTGGPGQVMVTALPLYHIFALTCCCLFLASMGGKCLLVANPRDIGGFIKLLKTAKFTMISGVNTLYNALMNHPEFKDINFAQLRFCVAGGMATQGAVARRWKELTGRPIIEGYGLSETSPVVTVNPTTIKDFSGTIGFPVAETDVAIRDENGQDVPAGEPGELCVRGPQVMSGYWNRPDETAKSMADDGYFKTGDVAVMLPDGQFKIVDRKKDMVLVSGFNVYPNEVEDVIASHPGVLEAAVIGAPDAVTGEAVVAHVVKRDPALTAEALIAHCREGLTGYKVPKQIVFRDALPKTNVGKVLRRMLRDEAPKA